MKKINNGFSINRAERLAGTSGFKGIIMMFVLLVLMCLDQFVLQIPFENIVFPVLVICAACMNSFKNFALIIMYSVIFELSCIAWNPWDLANAGWWLLEVFIGFCMPFAVYKLINKNHKDISIVSYGLIAAAGELLYFWVSILATILIWRVSPIVYILSDLPYQLLACLTTFVCTLPVAAIYKIYTGELFGKRKLRKKGFICF